MGTNEAEDERSIHNPDIPLSAAAIVDYLGPDHSTDAGVNVSEQSALSSAAVWAAVQLLSGAVGMLPVHVFKKLQGGGREQLNKRTTSPRFQQRHTPPASCAQAGPVCCVDPSATRWPGSLCCCPLLAVRSAPLDRTWVRSTPSERTRRPGLREDQKVPLPWNRPVFPESGNGGPFHPRRTDRCSRTPGKSVCKMHVPRVWNTAGSVPSP